MIPKYATAYALVTGLRCTLPPMNLISLLEINDSRGATYPPIPTLTLSMWSKQPKKTNSAL
uniref:Secreted protein n=1 Tax=Heterorhabditis bacteriophora TaxID=37862 RepID=A0A1I7XEQ7_HETBA